MNYFDNRFSEIENKMSMVMKIIQKISIVMIEKAIDFALDTYHLNATDIYLALSGGYALNCPTNTYLMHKYGFKGQLIPPHVNDGGQAIGMGLLHFHFFMDNINFKLSNSYCGDMGHEFSELPNSKYRMYIDTIEVNSDKFVEDIISSPIIWFDGRAEIGPRALGHRSILADPRNIVSKNLLNKYKQREWWRPVAPVILEEDLNDWFEKSFTSPYMLNNFLIKENKKEKVGAILHLDGTARVQTINANENNLLYLKICDFKKATDVPIVCNTSLNDKGEPIINTLSQALNFALRKGIIIVYFNGNRISLKNHNKFSDASCEERDCNIFNKNRKKSEIQSVNPNNLTLKEYSTYLYNPKLHYLSIYDDKDSRIIKRVTKCIEMKYSSINAYLTK